MVRKLTLRDVDAPFFENLGRASDGEPRRAIGRAGDAVAIVRASDCDAPTGSGKSLVVFLAISPHLDVAFDVERARDDARDLDP